MRSTSGDFSHSPGRDAVGACRTGVTTSSGATWTVETATRTRGALMSSLTYGASLLSVPQAMSVAMAGSAESDMLSWQCAAGVVPCPHTAAHTALVTGEPVSVNTI